jgi:hypothetical protein
VAPPNRLGVFELAPDRVVGQIMRLIVFSRRGTITFAFIALFCEFFAFFPCKISYTFAKANEIVTGGFQGLDCRRGPQPPELAR